MGKPKTFTEMEDSPRILTLAKELIMEHKKEDSKLIIAVNIINMVIKRLEALPEACDYKDACREEFEAKLPMKVREALSCL